MQIQEDSILGHVLAGRHRVNALESLARDPSTDPAEIYSEACGLWHHAQRIKALAQEACYHDGVL
jgi:hypothetical protein